MNTILQVRNLSVAYLGRRSAAQALSSVDLDVSTGEILGLVGESGCGKTTLALAILGLIEPPGEVEGGEIEMRLSNGSVENLAKITPKRLRQIRWRELAYIPQGSMSALNPVLSVERQMTDGLIEHGLSMSEALTRAEAALQTVSLEPDVLQKYPHELSGGMIQRVAIAASITLRPPLLIADEPTTALDVITQRSILQELMEIRDQLGTTIILISHDMGVMAQVVDRIAVMYAGKVVETGSVNDIFENPLHPYTRKLIGSIPRETTQRVEGLKGEAPSPWAQPPGCRFHPRCTEVMAHCRQVVPTLDEYEPKRWVACHLYDSSEERMHG